MADVTDATFQTDVIERSMTVPVVVDLWAPWCGPCKTLGPILEKVIGATAGRIELAKVNVDENPQVSQAFQVQSIPAVHALSGGAVVDSFMGAQGEPEVTAFVNKLLAQAPAAAPDAVAAPVDPIDELVEAGDEASLLAALELQADHVGAVTALAATYAYTDRGEEALALLARIPESMETRQIAALARSGGEGPGDDVEAKLESLLTKVKTDEEARQQFVDTLDLLGPDDPRTATFRKRLTSALY